MGVAIRATSMTSSVTFILLCIEFLLYSIPNLRRNCLRLLSLTVVVSGEILHRSHILGADDLRCAQRFGQNVDMGGLFNDMAYFEGHGDICSDTDGPVVRHQYRVPVSQSLYNIHCQVRCPGK